MKRMLREGSPGRTVLNWPAVLSMTSMSEIHGDSTQSCPDGTSSSVTRRFCIRSLSTRVCPRPGVVIRLMRTPRRVPG